MADEKSGEKGHPEALTGRAPGENSPADAADRPLDRAQIAAGVAELAGILDQGDDEPDLLDGSPDLLDLDGIAMAANQIAAPRRERGRPKGAANKRNDAVFDYLEKMGHRNPAVTLSMIQTADTKALAKALGVDTPKGRLAVLQLQMKAAADLMPYRYAKKVKAEVEVRKLHMFLAGSMNDAPVLGQAKGLSIFGTNEINGLAVRQTDGQSHENEKPNDHNVIGGESD